MVSLRRTVRGLSGSVPTSHARPSNGAIHAPGNPFSASSAVSSV